MKVQVLDMRSFVFSIPKKFSDPADFIAEKMVNGSITMVSKLSALCDKPAVFMSRPRSLDTRLSQFRDTSCIARWDGAGSVSIWRSRLHLCFRNSRQVLYKARSRSWEKFLTIDPSTEDMVKLKVGRAVNLIRRIDQWEKQCGSKEQVLRGWYPGTVEPQESEGPGSLLKGRVKAGERGLWCHRLERLIHLELADLVTTSIYLQPTWPRLGRNFESSTLEAGSLSSPTPHCSASCSDCGSHHKEIFQFKKMRGRNQGKEWELIVQPVIRRWGTFVHQCVWRKSDSFVRCQCHMTWRDFLTKQ